MILSPQPVAAESGEGVEDPWASWCQVSLLLGDPLGRRTAKHIPAHHA
jgi:hypothetical protein